MVGILLATVLAATLLTGWAPGWLTGPDGARDVRRPEPKTVDVGEFTAGGSSHATAVQAAIDASSPGQTVVFPAGVYVLDRPIRFASRRNYAAADGARVVLRAAGADGVTIEQDLLRDVTISGLEFDNVRVALIGSDDYSAVSDVTLRDCWFRNGRTGSEWGVAYVLLRHTSGVTVEGCEFLRDRAHPGRGVVADTTRLTVVKDSWFGTTPDLDPAVPDGWFRTAVNVWGHDLATGRGNDEVVVDGNVWRRTPGIGAPAGCAFCQDHGLYAWGSRRLSIVGNRADGWDASPAGGSMKLRNQYDTFVVGNRMRSSGIYTYVYASQNMPEVFRRVSIRDNGIDMRGATGCRHYCGVTYWRDAEITGQQGPPERDVFIGGNSFLDGGLISVSSSRAREFCVQGNPRAVLTSHLGSVRTSNCGAAPEWEDPFAGLHRGDFDGDGRDDFVQLVRPRDRDPYWRAHLSAGSGVDIQRWPARLDGAQLAARFGVQVGDFDGDGHDDLAWAGSCSGETHCWRVALGGDDGFAPPKPWARLGPITGETTDFGVQVGDFDGDARDDLLYRARCGPSDERCWRMLSSDGESFQAGSWGDGSAWTAESAVYGLLVADFTGDGRDDVAYRGACGNDGEPCFRMHVSGDHGFQVRSWGDDFWPAADGSTAHYGLSVGDVDGDGDADLGYRGLCGDGESQWRYHLSTGSGFTVTCATRAKLPPAPSPR
ncbi:FG-GAP-like repeat-containing protein [Jiangella mangrovi]|uniref:FG-GAP-like repeat-containing protein n=1 Tax=Jiangella mangrovi TaxID=1524084 RepID=UPI00160B52F8